MNKTTLKTRAAWVNRVQNKTISENTKIINGKLYLFNNLIAWRGNGDRVYFSMCGWDSVTTKERLQAVGVMLCTRRGMVYLSRYKNVDKTDTYYVPDELTRINTYATYMITENGLRRIGPPSC